MHFAQMAKSYGKAKGSNLLHPVGGVAQNGFRTPFLQVCQGKPKGHFRGPKLRVRVGHAQVVFGKHCFNMVFRIGLVSGWFFPVCRLVVFNIGFVLGFNIALSWPSSAKNWFSSGLALLCAVPEMFVALISYPSGSQLLIDIVIVL